MPIVRIDPFSSLSAHDRRLLEKMWANRKESASRRGRVRDVDAEAEAWYQEDLVVYVYEDGHRVVAPRSQTVGIGDMPGATGWHGSTQEYVLGLEDGLGRAGKISAAERLVLESELFD